MSVRSRLRITTRQLEPLVAFLENNKENLAENRKLLQNEAGMVVTSGRPSSCDKYLTRYGCSAPACVLRIATVVTTADEAFHRRRRETLRPGSHVMKGSTSDCVGPPTYGSFGRLPFFIATWIN
ncbi:hypothetical protein GEV33_000428 [Tenebrio molitor]|uniref:Uncharacterized protein n=1 Tax=Tenebrio molitor TaxID=7067 RepID=A0A8J6HZK2_TENMO|nr:hypothetical protein GEV33_000428 [Tenebrio molitor]